MASTIPAFPEYRFPPQKPVSLIRTWLEEAKQDGVREPGAVSLATAGGDGRATNRIVQILDVRDCGLIFATHATSPKGCQIMETGWSSGCFYWREQGRQMIVSGPTTRMEDGESDLLWKARPRLAHTMSVLAKQSQPLEDDEELRLRASELRESSDPLPRPQEWAGYVIRPAVVEFWQADPERLHQRLEYRKSAVGWSSSRLQP